MYDLSLKFVNTCFLYLSSYTNKSIYQLNINQLEYIKMSGIGNLTVTPLFDETNTYMYQACSDYGCIFKIRYYDNVFFDKNNIIYTTPTYWVSGLGKFKAQVIIQEKYIQ